MKKKTISLIFFLFVFSSVFSNARATEFNISDTLTSGFEYEHVIRIMDEEKIEATFGANWQQNFLFKGKELNQVDKIRIIRMTSNVTNGKDSWYILYDYWELTSGEFIEASERIGQPLYKNPEDWGTVHNWGTHIAMPGPVNEFLAEMDFDDNFEVNGYDLTWNIDKDSTWGNYLGLQQDAIFFYGYKAGYDLLATFRIKNSDGEVMFEYDENPENSIQGFNFTILLFISMISVAFVILKLKFKDFKSNL